MTDAKHNPNPADDGDRDVMLEMAVRKAYEEMSPSSEQEQRMLSALLEAERAASSAAGSAVQDDVEALPGGSVGVSAATENESPTETVVAPAANRSRGIKAWKVALPVAACLVVGAVFFGIAGQQGQTASAPIASSAAPSAAASAESASPSATLKTESADGVAEEGDAEMYALESGAVDMEALASTAGAVESRGFVDDTAPLPDDDFNTEEYDALEERGFISTKTSPLSTVSADVDTASYCNVRRMINDGYALSDIPTGAVRIEEMLNYFDYDYPTVTCGTGGDLFSMQAQSAPCPWNEDTQLLVCGFAAAPEDNAASKGSNLVFLIDVSGSMDSPDKLDLLQDSFATLLESLDAGDRVSIVTYASGEEIVLEGASGDDDKEILRAIYKLHAEGSTNGEAGLSQAYEVAERNFIEGGVNRIIMASDGDLNVGITSESDLYDFVDKKRESGVYLSVLGFGSGNYKDNKMETLADHGNGSYHYIDCIDEAERVLKDKLTANLVPFADDVKVQVEFNPAQVKAYRLIGHENRAIADEDFRDDTVDAGDVGPGAQFTVAYEIVPIDSKMKIDEPELKYSQGDSAPSQDFGKGEWLTCTMRYHVFDGDEMHEQQLAVDGSSVAARPSDDWKFAAAVIEFGMLARDSKYAGTSSVDSILDLLGTGLNDERDAFKRLVVKAC